MADGSFNRISGITLSSSQPKQPASSSFPFKRFRKMLCGNERKPRSGKLSHYILRVPRNTECSLLHQATTLLYVQKKFPKPTPQLHTYSSTSDNALDRPYMLLERLPGQTLEALWPTLNQEQRKSAVKCITEVLRDLQKITNKTAGILSARNTNYDIKQNLLRVEPIPISAANVSMNTPLAKPQTTRALLLELCQRQQDDTRSRGLQGYDHVWDGFVKITGDLFSLGLIPDKDPFHFYHADLQSRNLLFTIQSPAVVRLTGVLDWDSAIFAPKFMSTRAPFFLWSKDDADDNEEDSALLEPEHAEKAELKRTFEQEVGEAFCKESYRKEYVLARRMWYFMGNGLGNDGDVPLAEKVLGLWSGLYPVN